MKDLILFYDTETSGLPVRKLPLSAARQPHIVQLAAQLVDDGDREIASLNVVIRPDGWEIDATTAQIHGITNDLASSIGVREDVAVDLFVDMWEKASLRVGHNEAFDADILSIAIDRHLSSRELKKWEGGKAFCTMSKLTDIICLPLTDKQVAAGIKGWKRPNLKEAYRHCTGHELISAHNAMADTMACRAVYNWLKRRE